MIFWITVFWVAVIVNVGADICCFAYIGTEAFDAIGYAMVLQVAGICLGVFGIMPLAFVAIGLATGLLITFWLKELRDMLSQTQDP